MNTADVVLVRTATAAADAQRWSAELGDVDFVTDETGADPSSVTIVAGHVGDEEIPRFTALEWVHSWAAGVEGDVGPGLRSAGKVVTSSSGNGAIPLAEHAMMLALITNRDAMRWFAAQTESRWDRFTHAELAGRVMTIFGFGNIGRELAARAKAFGMTVLAVRRDTAASDENVDRFHAPEQIVDVAAASDVLVVTAPLTSQTRGVIGADVISALPKGAAVIVVSRGGIVDDDALLDALDKGAIVAALDAHSTEPLPRSSPFWGHPGVIITPHNGATTQETAARGQQIFLGNLRRRRSGLPLQNVVDLALLG